MLSIRLKIRSIYFFLLLIIVSFGNGSCGKKVYPSGLEGNLLAFQKNYNREQQQRRRVARSSDRKYQRELRRERREYLQEVKQFEKERERFVENHFDRQEPHVQERMKKSIKETKKYYSSQRSLKDKLVFWKKNKCPHGIG